LPTKIKLDYPVLPAGHQVWMVRPGAGYRLARAFREAEAIAPDVPLLNLNNGQPATSAANLDAQLRRGREWRDWEDNGSRPEQRPSTSERDYTIALNDGITHTRAKNTVIKIFDEIPDGALVFVPGASLADDALLGTIASSTADRVTVTRKWGEKELAFQGRSLLNPLKIPMRLLPPEVTDRRKNRGVVAEEIVGSARIRLYREYFNSFSLDGGDAYAQFRGGNAAFPAAALGSLVTLMRYVIEAKIEGEKARAEGRPAVLVDPIRLASLIWSTDQNLLIHARVNSPFGRVTFQSARPAIYAAIAFISLATLDADAQVMDDLASGTTQVENVCEEPASLTASAQNQADTVGQTLFDFYAIFGAQTCEQVLAVTRKTVESTLGTVDAEAER
jgi:hypothetical protein